MYVAVLSLSSLQLSAILGIQPVCYNRQNITNNSIITWQLDVQHKDVSSSNLSRSKMFPILFRHPSTCVIFTLRDDNSVWRIRSHSGKWDYYNFLVCVVQRDDAAVWVQVALSRRPLLRSWACFMTCEIEADSLSEHQGSRHATAEAWVRRHPIFLWMLGHF